MGEEGLAGSEEIPGSGRIGTDRQGGDPRKWENRDWQAARRSEEVGEEGLAGSEEIPGGGRRGTGRQRGDPWRWEKMD